MSSMTLGFETSKGPHTRHAWNFVVVLWDHAHSWCPIENRERLWPTWRHTGGLGRPTPHPGQGRPAERRGAVQQTQLHNLEHNAKMSHSTHAEVAWWTGYLSWVVDVSGVGVLNQQGCKVQHGHNFLLELW